jgi:hypothetical protein
MKCGVATFVGSSPSRNDEVVPLRRGSRPATKRKSLRYEEGSRFARKMWGTGRELADRSAALGLRLVSSCLECPAIMRQRPVYRWKSFWLGVLVLAFLGWAWVRSMSWEIYLSWGTETRGALVFTNRTGEVSLGWLGYQPGGEAAYMLGLMDGSGEVWPPGEAPWFPRFAEVKSEPGVYRSFTMAHWFVMVMFAMAWGAMLTWRWRKHRGLESKAA